MYINIYESKQFLENILFSIICVLLFIYMYTNPNRHAFLFFVFVYRYLLTLVYILLSCNFNCFSFIFTKIEFVVLNQAGNNFCYSSIKRHALRSPPRYIIAIWFRKLCECLCAHMCNIYIYIQALAGTWTPHLLLRAPWSGNCTPCGCYLFHLALKV